MLIFKNHNKFQLLFNFFFGKNSCSVSEDFQWAEND